MNLKRFFVYSFAVHAIILSVILFALPAEKDMKKGREFFTSLASPKDLLSQSPVIKPPASRAVPKVQRPSPAMRDKMMPRTDKEASHSKPGVLQGDNKNNLPSPPLSSGAQGGFPGGGKDSVTGRGSIPHPDTAGPSLREKLFDKSIINELAKRDIEKEEKKDKTFTLDTSEYKFLIYNKRLKERIENIWMYPPDAAAGGIYGDLVIKFTIKKNGKLGAVELVRTSGHKNLDDAAIRALKDGDPYWPLPEEWGMEVYTIVGHFVYTLYGYYIR
ncbi:MAG: TonB C-terminal domain-containing protein [Nitrospira sp.]|nr:TonB C-terminal domain-containing protein [Nitrospira sp.]